MATDAVAIPKLIDTDEVRDGGVQSDRVAVER